MLNPLWLNLRADRNIISQQAFNEPEMDVMEITKTGILMYTMLLVDMSII